MCSHWIRAEYIGFKLATVIHFHRSSIKSPRLSASRSPVSRQLAESGPTQYAEAPLVMTSSMITTSLCGS